MAIMPQSVCIRVCVSMGRVRKQIQDIRDHLDTIEKRLNFIEDNAGEHSVTLDLLGGEDEAKP